MVFLLMKWDWVKLFKLLLYLLIFLKEKAFGVLFWWLHQIVHFTIGNKNLKNFAHL